MHRKILRSLKSKLDRLKKKNPKAYRAREKTLRRLARSVNKSLKN